MANTRDDDVVFGLLRDGQCIASKNIPKQVVRWAKSTFQGLFNQFVDEDRLRAAGLFAADQWRDVVSALQRVKLIKLDEDRRWRLGRDLKTVTLWQLVQIFPEHVTKESLSASSDFPALERSLLSLVEYGEAHLSLSLDEIFTD